MPVNASQTVRPSSPVILEEGANRKDKGYRRYASNVERALSLFDTALQEWADYIAFLGRLLKALQSKPSGTADVPHKALVAKRLAQCLDPALPSGVHQKALEVYAYLFSTLDRDGLSRDLSLYLPGLAPTLSFASLSVKPTLLSLFETFISPLDPVILRSALKAITLALLPGLEEETSEEFERTLSLLNRFRGAVGQGLDRNNAHSSIAGDQYYWQSLFLASITSPSRRQGALAYMIRELPPLGTSTRPYSESSNAGHSDMGGVSRKLAPQIEAVTIPEPGLLIRCFAAGLQDEQLLIQRGFLDLLVTHLPLHSAVLHQKVVPRDLELLVSAAAAVVVRREMSLNRRLWTWFLGPEVSSGPDDSSPSSPDSSPTISPGRDHKSQMSQSQYFERYGLAPLVSSVLKMVNDSSLNPAEKARPFRICLSLMDRWEIGGLVVPRLFLPAMKSVWRYQRLAISKGAVDEVLRSANVFFDAIESSLIWAELTEIVIEALKTINTKPKEGDSLSPKDRLDLVLFLITNFNIREEEMLSLHIPLLALALTVSLRSHLEAPLDDAKKSLEPTVDTALDILIHLIDLVPTKVLGKEGGPWSDARGNGQQGDNTPQILHKIRDFYHSSQRSSGEAIPPFDNTTTRDLLLHNAIRLVAHGLDTPSQAAYLDKEAAFLDKILRKARVSGREDDQETDFKALAPIMSSLSIASNACAATDGNEIPPFPSVAVLISALEMIRNAWPSNAWNSNHSVRPILPNLLTGLWMHISPARPRHCVEAVRGLWRIHAVSPDVRLVESTIATLMLRDEDGHRGQNVNIEGARRFATVWAHSGPASKALADRHLRAGGVHQSGRRSNESIELVQPLLLLLDSLFDPKTELFVFAVGWLQSLSSIQLIIDFLISRLDASSYLKQEGSSVAQTDEEEMLDVTGASLEVDDCLYYLQHILHLTKYSTANTMASFAGRLHATNPSKDKQFDEAETSGPVKVVVDVEEPVVTIQAYLVRVCMRILEDHQEEQGGDVRYKISVLRQTSASLLKQMLLGPSSTTLVAMNLEDSLVRILSWSVEKSDHMLQLPLMDVILIILRARLTRTDVLSKPHRRPTSRDTIRSASQLSVSTDKGEKDNVTAEPSIQTSALLDCLTFGISSPNNHPVLEQWIRFLDNCLPFYSSNAFQVLMPLVDTFSRSIESVFQNLQAAFAGNLSGSHSAGEPITVLNALLNGLEQVLARGHDHLLQDEGHSVATKSPEQVQGFFGNMVSGVFASEAQKSRPTTANNRLTVLLCFKDAVRVSFNMWSWGEGGSPRDAVDSASFSYMSIRLRNRTRRILNHLFAAEALECLETLVEFWHKADSEDNFTQSSTVFNLLHALEASRPKNTIPALFNAMYSRTNPNVLDPIRKSTLTSELSDINLAVFLVAYTRSMEEDALDEMWTDCMTFLRDVLGNPLPHRQTLPILLNFTAILGQKIDNTNFGEQRKMRRDIGDLFVRLLAATFTIKPLAFPQDVPITMKEERIDPHSSEPFELRRLDDLEDVVAIIASILPNISKILVDADRILAATTTISTQVLAPTFRWKTFPRNITGSLLDIMKTMSRVPEASKIWRKDVAEAFNDPRFFHTSSLDLVWNGWMPVLRQWALLDKDRMPELLSRLSSPTSAGIMFGVGASSARLEADRKTQLNLRRIATLMLSADNDMFVVNLGGIQEKTVDLMTATATSSPSSTTRSEIYMLLRALILKTSPVHLAPFWPIVNAELYDALSSLSPADGATHDTYSTSCVLQAAKLLDTLLTVAPDDFQLREWLFVTDTIDAVYRPADWRPVALVDGLAETLDSRAGAPHSGFNPLVGGAQQGLRGPLLTRAVVGGVPMESVIDRVLRPFLRQLSINAFESTYRMEAPDLGACCDDLLEDLFDEGTLV